MENIAKEINQPTPTTSGLTTTNITGLIYIADPAKIMGQIPLLGPSNVLPYSQYNSQLYDTYDLTKNAPTITSPSLIQSTEGTTYAEAFRYYDNIASTQEGIFGKNKQFYNERLTRWKAQGIPVDGSSRYIYLLNIVISRDEYLKLNEKIKNAYIPLENFIIPSVAPTIGDDFDVPINNGTFTGPYFTIEGKESYVIMGKSQRFMPGGIPAFVKTIDGYLVEFDLYELFSELKYKGQEKSFSTVANTFLTIMSKSKYADIAQLTNSPTWFVLTHLGRSINSVAKIMVERVISDYSNLSGWSDVIRAAFSISDTAKMLKTLI